MRRALWPLAALTVLVAGCGSGPTGTGTSTATSTAYQKALRFAACMRAHGVGGFPDPDASGTYTIDGIVNGSSLNPNSPAFERALEACRALEPPGFTGSKVTPEQTVARLAFARCVRANGVPDFPDPTPSSPLVDTNRIPSASTPAGMSALNAALRKCGADFAGRLGVQGR